MRILSVLLFLVLMSSCSANPKKNIKSANELSDRENIVATQPNGNNINVAFIKSQLSSLNSQIWDMEAALMGAQARLDRYKSMGIPGKDEMVTSAKAEITNFEAQRENLKAQKVGLEMQLMLNQ